ncbi:hypothetical protein DC498_09105 [Terrimonas sp.]|uniref:hypothetical protein n=1 Tax=Terrimonas sp. TaxID=1914338 RepID=UPI000D52047A|nr:hypothetical protein [Terrimonas sp.]PVD52661.1 hypothetical protein DC498_09105 [Terrimonas sp.]
MLTKNNYTPLYVGVLLFVPFLSVYIFTTGLTNGLDPIFSIDEPTHHYPTILAFAKQMPFLYLKDYSSATTPLFHILVAAISKVIGTDIETLRLVNFFITYASVVLLFNILIRRFRLSVQSSFLFALLFALSPYYFREAFVLLTDNLPVLWLLCFFNFYLRYKQEGKERLFLISLLFVMLMGLTRQTYLFVCLPILADILKEDVPVKQKALHCFFLFLAAAPTLYFFVLWQGLTPPSFTEWHTRKTSLSPKAILYGLSTVGFYSIFIPGINIFASLCRKENALIIFSGLLLVWGVTFFFPLIKGPKDFGFLWYMAEPFSKVADSAILFYILGGLGIIYLLGIGQKKGSRFYILFLLGLFLSEIPNDAIFQRYYDNSILLALIFLSAEYYVSDKIDTCRRIALIAFFVMYFIVYTVA